MTQFLILLCFRSINSSLRRCASEMSPQDIANSAYSLSMLAFDSENIYDPALRGSHETLLETIRKLLNSQEGRVLIERVSNNFEGYSKNNVQSKDDKSTILNNYTTSATILSAYKEFEQLRIFANYIFALQRVVDINTIPKILLGPLLTTNGSYKNPSISSNLQNNVLFSLSKSLNASIQLIEGENFKEYSIVYEYSCFNGVFPVDAAIFKQGYLVALIEVDGPHHYRSDGSLRRKDLLKVDMYKNVNPDILFQRIRWDETNKLGADAITEELASTIILHARRMSNWKSTFRSFERKVATFFSWSLRND